ncbi:MAG TPA: GEVED domain-containing protein [Chitinophagaceae bacterium]
MRKLLPLVVAIAMSICGAQAQCPAGYKSAALNWDGLDYFSTTGYNMNPLSGTMSPNQTFAFGKNRLNITYANGITSVGENGGHTGSNAISGESVQFTGNGTVTLTFANEVANLKFSIHDIDYLQNLQISASNATNVLQNIDIALLGNNILTLSGDNSVNPSVADNTTGGNKQNPTFGTVVAASVLDASLDVAIAGPVKTITLTTSNTGTVTSGSQASQENGSYWLSDISACITETYTPNYYSVSQPFTGMPAYVLAAINNSVYMVDPATGKAKFVFSDGANSGTINSLAYDPYNKVAYFCWSLTNNGSTTASSKTLHKYDFKTGNVTTIANDVNTFGLPTFNQGTESGAAAFYDGALYIGIEGGADNGSGGPRTTTTGIESIVWRMTFNSSGAPENISQVYSTSGDTHDWGDFGISNDTLYDFNGESGGAHYQHVSLYTGYNTRVEDVNALPRQTAVGWDGTIYNMGNTIGAYDLNGRTGTTRTISSTPTLPNWSNTGAPSFGDAAEAFRPAVDFGDAPLTYDPDPVAPALHETISTLRLGATTDVEWDKVDPGTGATIDGSDEDGLAYARIFVNGANYVADLSVFNNTGTVATVCAWLDFNNDGMFQSTEGISQTVTSSTTTQPVSLFWPSPVSSLPNNSYTYLRIRITTAAMTTSQPTGYFPDGEVEDYYVFVSNTPLDVKLKDFTAKKANDNKVSLAWSVTDEEANTRYELQKSGNGQDWSVIHKRVAQQDNAQAAYESFDGTPIVGDNYYRLKISEADGSVVYSAIKKVVFEKPVVVLVTPNPASSNVRIMVQSGQRSSAHIRIVDMNGRSVYERDIVVEAGVNGYTLPVSQWPSGVYQAEIWINAKRHTQQLIVSK